MYHTTAHQSQEITIRLARSADAEQIRRLAQRDSASEPVGELLVALVGDQMRAAVSIEGGQTIADPFHPSTELVALLSERAEQMNPRKGRGLLSRLAGRERGHRPHRGSISPQPAGTMRAFE